MIFPLHMVEIFDVWKLNFNPHDKCGFAQFAHSKLKIRHTTVASNVKNEKEILIPCDTIAIKYDIPLRFICHGKEHELSR